MSWKKVKLSELLKQIKIIVQIDNSKEYKLVTVSSKGTIKQREVVKGVEIKGEKAFEAKKGSFIYSRLSVHNGAFGIVPIELEGALLTSEMPIFDISDRILPEFLIYSLQLPTFKFQLEQLTKGVGRTRVKEANFLSLSIDLPSIEDQKEIVNSFIIYEDKSASISTELTHQLTLVKKLRQQLLQDAVQGKLVEQNKKDEPASELLKKIKTEKDKLIAEKKLKKQKELPPIKPEEIPFEIPENWVWCRLGEVGKITGGGTPSMANEEYWNGNIPWVSPKDMWTDFVTDTEMKVTPKGINESSTNLIPVGSLLIVGRSGILKRKLPVAINSVECTVNQDMKVIIPHLIEMNRFLQFMFWGLESIILKEYVKFGMTVHSLKYNEFSQMPIPLPPLAEQNRIVQKLDELMQYCNNLEASIKQSESQNEKLLQQILREALRKEPVEV